jgi:hypothetical protein
MKISMLPLCAAAVAAAAVLSHDALAQEPPPPAGPPPVVATQETTSQATGPSWAMVTSGVVVFGLAYVPAAVVAGSSNLSADHNLYVPLAGPWMDLVQRPGCSNGDCTGENTAKVGLVIDGIFQGVGALTTIGGFLTAAHSTTTVQRAADLKPKVRLAPAQVASGYGMVAVGSF